VRGVVQDDLLHGGALDDGRKQNACCGASPARQMPDVEHQSSLVSLPLAAGPVHRAFSQPMDINTGSRKYVFFKQRAERSRSISRIRTYIADVFPTIRRLVARSPQDSDCQCHSRALMDRRRPSFTERSMRHGSWSGVAPDGLRNATPSPPRGLLSNCSRPPRLESVITTSCYRPRSRASIADDLLTEAPTGFGYYSKRAGMPFANCRPDNSRCVDGHQPRGHDANGTRTRRSCSAASVPGYQFSKMSMTRFSGARTRMARKS
jgi:hypothetical protein